MPSSKILIALSLLAGLVSAQGQTQTQSQATLTSPLMEGQCSTGAAYKLQTYQHHHAGQLVKGYAYEGPLGQGTVLSTVPLDQAKQLVCKESGVGRWLPDDGDDQ